MSAVCTLSTVTLISLIMNMCDLKNVKEVSATKPMYRG